MSFGEHRLYAVNLICIGIDQTESGDYSGRIWHQYQDEPIRFKNAMDLIREMDMLYDEWNFPQKSTAGRQFEHKHDSTENQHKRRAVAPMDVRRIQDKKGDKGTFIVHVKYRQNATWQGEVIWAERNKKQCFRSALELLKLIDGALDGGAGETEDIEEIEDNKIEK